MAEAFEFPIALLVKASEFPHWPSWNLKLGHWITSAASCKVSFKHTKPNMNEVKYLDKTFLQEFRQPWMEVWRSPPLQCSNIILRAKLFQTHKGLKEMHGYEINFFKVAMRKLTNSRYLTTALILSFQILWEKCPGWRNAEIFPRNVLFVCQMVIMNVFWMSLAQRSRSHEMEGLEFAGL